MSREPHYVRFAQALALVTGLAGVTLGCSATTNGGGDTGTGGNDTGTGGNDAAMVADSGGGETDSGGGGTDSGGGGTDSGSTMDDASSNEDGGIIAEVDAATFDCLTCECFRPGIDAGPGTAPSCEDLGATIPCCAAVGPLAPPDLLV